jgi:hypothetical protein
MLLSERNDQQKKKSRQTLVFFLIRNFLETPVRMRMFSNSLLSAKPNLAICGRTE